MMLVFLFVDQRTLNELADELAATFAQLGLAASVSPSALRDNQGRLEVEVDGRHLEVDVLTRADLRPPAARDLPEVPDGSGLVFADRLAEHTREVLRERGWGWLDRRRGHLRLWCPGLRLDASVAPTAAPQPTRVRDPFSPTGRQVALWLLLHPDEPASPRGMARELGVSAGQVSNLLQALEAQALLRRDRTPLVPELFWALVDHWRPRRHALLTLPTLDQLAGAPELASSRWVVGDTRAASAFGAPVVAPPDYPPDLYVPDQKVLSWLLNRCELAPEYGRRVATVAVAPTPLVVDRRFRREDPSGGPWPLAHPVMVALDLAVDRSRGREVVEAWEPEPSLGVTRVW